MFEKYFSNNFKFKNDVYIINKSDNYTENFGKQWKKYKKVQIDSINKFNISEKFLEKIIFNKLEYLKNKTVLEIGCGAGRFTEHIIKYCKLCVSVDMSNAIFHNIVKNQKKLILVKSDFTELNILNKFDIIICRGVLQHTPNPLFSIKKIHEFINTKGEVFFDIYPMPKIGLLHPKYIFWRPIISNLIKYEKFEKFLHKNIKLLLAYKRIINNFTKSNFISDCIIPIWDYKNIIPLTEEQLNEWAILDTLDGIYAKYDNPKSSKKIIKFLKKEKIKLLHHNKKENIFNTKII